MKNIPYQPGETVSLTLDPANESDAPRSLDALIQRTFTPFTKSQVLLLSNYLSSGLPISLPNLVIAKVFDRRYFNDREELGHPWSPASEEAAVTRWNAIASGERPDDFDETDSDDYDLAQWEERYARVAQERFTTEAEAYHRLRDLQGKGVPRCFGTFTLANADPWQRFRSFFLEYIDAPSLADVDKTAVPRSVVHSLLDLVRGCNARGVIHADIRSHNILISLPEPSRPDPPRAVLIDFGFAILREQDEDDDAWAETMLLEDDLGALKHVLHRQGLRELSPIPVPTPGSDCVHFVHTLENARPSWRDRWYERTGKDEGCGWKFKPDVAHWFADSDSIGPRPGTPE